MNKTTDELYRILHHIVVHYDEGFMNVLDELYDRALRYDVEVVRNRPVPTTELKYPAPSKELLDKMDDFGVEICKSIDEQNREKKRKKYSENEYEEVSKEDSENMQQSIELTNKNSGFTYTSEEDPAFADEEYPKLDDDTDMDELEFASEETTKQAFEDMKSLMSHNEEPDYATKKGMNFAKNYLEGLRDDDEEEQIEDTTSPHLAKALLNNEDSPLPLFCDDMSKMKMRNDELFRDIVKSAVVAAESMGYPICEDATTSNKRTDELWLEKTIKHLEDYKDLKDRHEKATQLLKEAHDMLKQLELFHIPEDYFVNGCDLDVEEPYCYIVPNGDICAEQVKRLIPKSLAYYLSTHFCGSNRMHTRITENERRRIQHEFKILMGI